MTNEATAPIEKPCLPFPWHALDGCLLLDLEVSPAGKILKIGAELDGKVFTGGSDCESRGSLEDLASFSTGARLLVGHNILDHDLWLLRDKYPGHALLQLPAVDTLLLSPICFPESPYHRLVKDYKLVSESVNDPVADAKLAGILLQDEIAALRALRETELTLFDLLHFLLTETTDDQNAFGRGAEILFQSLGATRISRADALVFTRQLFARWGCSSYLVDESIFDGSTRMALAYTVAWLRVAGATSVLPPWVRAQYPAVLRIIAGLRETPCTDPKCSYCSKYHNSRDQLRTFFGYDEFRSVPRNGQGGSLQQDIVEAGMRNGSLLAILPTSGGKSICFQLPALVRNFRRGALTIVISPLQSLMKDQVDGLSRRTGTPFAAALYGLLTPPERGDVLRRVRMGDIAILYVSPEQLRNRPLVMPSPNGKSPAGSLTKRTACRSGDTIFEMTICTPDDSSASFQRVTG